MTSQNNSNNDNKAPSPYPEAVTPTDLLTERNDVTTNGDPSTENLTTARARAAIA